jgi:hypothetical protein
LTKKEDEMTTSYPNIPCPIAAAALVAKEVSRAIKGTTLKIQLEPRIGFNGEGLNIAYDAEVVWSRIGPDGRLGWGTHAGTVELRHTAWGAALFCGHYDLTEKDALADRATDVKHPMEFFGPDIPSGLLGKEEV